jgi:hypothetical protein
MNIIWVLILITNNQYTLVESFPNKSSCEYYKKKVDKTLCFPVNVSNKVEIEEQVENLNKLLKE